MMQFKFLWEIQMPNINRRKVLKGLSATGVAVIAPFSLHAAKVTNTDQNIAIYVDAKHGKFKNSTSNEIVNQGTQPIVLNTNEPVLYKNTNGQNVSLYINSSANSHTLQPGERLPVYARATMINSLNIANAQNNSISNSIAIV